VNSQATQSPSAVYSPEVPLAGYVDRLSGRAGDTFNFKVSCTTEAKTINAKLVQSICADCNPNGPGIIERAADNWFEPSQFPARHQPFTPGSYARSIRAIELRNAECLQFKATIWPTIVKDRLQSIISHGEIALQIDDNGYLRCKIGHQFVALDEPLSLRNWLNACTQIDFVRYEVSVYLLDLSGKEICATTQTVDKSLLAEIKTNRAPILIAASHKSNDRVSDFFNGKIESPNVSVATSTSPMSDVASWDFSIDIGSTQVHDTSANGLHASLINYPTRAMTGSSWQGQEMCWRYAPVQYGAIHFHEDDIVDFNWETDFSFTVPVDMPSGVYVMRLHDGQYEDAIPIYICAINNRSRKPLCVLIPTFTYAIYGNHARPDWTPEWKDRNNAQQAYPWNPAEYPDYGLSTYNYHHDGSGICHASHERPLFNMRPGYVTFGNSDCSGLRHFQADSHLLAWLDAHDIPFDIITDRELHNEGVDCIKHYKAVMTTTHPEYHTPQSLDALTHYKDAGGHLLCRRRNPSVGRRAGRILSRFRWCLRWPMAT